MPGFTELPTEVDGSLGRDKSDIDPVPNYEQFVPAEEWNTVKHSVAILAERMGLGDGSQPSTVEEFLAAQAANPIYGPLDSARYFQAEDFSYNSGAFTWTLAPTYGAPSVALLAAAQLGNSATFIQNPLEVNLIWNARVKVDNSTNTVRLRLNRNGFSDNVALTKGTSSGWKVVSSSVRSGGLLTQTVDNVGTYDTNWTTFSIVFSAANTSTTVFQDGVQIAAFTGNNVVAQGSYRVEFEGILSAIHLDYSYVEGDR